MSAAGNWTLALQTPIGERKATLTLTAAGALLSGRMTAEDGNATDIVDGDLSSDKVSCDHATGSTFGLRITTATCTATDSHNNTVRDGTVARFQEFTDTGALSHALGEG